MGILLSSIVLAFDVADFVRQRANESPGSVF